MHVNIAYIKFILALIIYGSNGIYVTQIGLPSAQMVFLRTVLGFGVLFIIFLALRKKFTFHKKPKDFIFLALSGLSLGFAWLSLFVAYLEGGICFGTLAYYCGPVIIMVLTPFIFKERLTVARVVGFVVALIGVALFNGQAFFSGVAPIGVFTGALSAIFAASMIMLNKKAAKIDGMENPVIQLFFAMVAATIFILVTGQTDIQMTQSDILPMVLLGVVNTGLTGYLYFSSITKLPAQTVATVGYLEPLAAVVISAIVIGESLLPLEWIGGFCIIAGAVFAEGVGMYREHKALKELDLFKRNNG